MKKYISLFALLPLYTLAMFHGPVTHSTQDCLAVRKYSFEDINKLTVAELSAKMESLLQDNDFRIELPILIQEGNALVDDIEKNAGVEKCLVYGKCCAKTMIAAGLSGCVAHVTSNIDLGEWVCLTGTGVACYECNTKLRRNSQMRNDVLEKTVLLLQGGVMLQRSALNTLIQQNRQALALIVEAAGQQAGAVHPAQDQYDFSYTEEHR